MFVQNRYPSFSAQELSFDSSLQALEISLAPWHSGIISQQMIIKHL